MLVCLACTKQTHLPSPARDDHHGSLDDTDLSSLGCKTHSPTKQHIKSFTNQVKEIVMKWAYKGCKGPCIFRCRAEQGMQEMQQIQILMAAQGSDLQLRRISDQINELLRLGELEKRIDIRSRCSFCSSYSDGGDADHPNYGSASSPGGAEVEDEFILSRLRGRRSHGHEFLRSDDVLRYDLLPMPALLQRSRAGEEQQQTKKKKKKKRRKMKNANERIITAGNGCGDGALFLQVPPGATEGSHPCSYPDDSAGVRLPADTAGTDLELAHDIDPKNSNDSSSAGPRSTVQDEQSPDFGDSSSAQSGPLRNPPQSAESVRPDQSSELGIATSSRSENLRNQIEWAAGDVRVVEEQQTESGYACADQLGFPQDGRRESAECNQTVRGDEKESDGEAGLEEQRGGRMAKKKKKNGGYEEEEEWTAQVEPGVIITFVALRDGCNSLKRIRFSQEMFSKWQAQRWWAENSEMVHELFSVVRRGESPINGGHSSSQRSSTSCASSSYSSPASQDHDRPLQNTPEEGSPVHGNESNYVTMVQSKLIQLCAPRLCISQIRPMDHAFH